MYIPVYITLDIGFNIGKQNLIYFKIKCIFN